MKEFRLFLILSWNLLVSAYFVLFETEHRSWLSMFSSSYQTFDCLFFHSTNDFTKQQWIPYCRRPAPEEHIEISPNSGGKPIKFNDLYNQGVTGVDLLSWFAPVDVAELYEKHRGTNSNEIFYNCSIPWFGSHCQYRFEDDQVSSFNEIILSSFEQRSMLCFNNETNACYPFLSTCNNDSSSVCLDWRVICDGKKDCISGEDEQFCNELELRKCAPDEYRCHYGGQCIPLIFLRDDEENIDCLDGSDEADQMPHSVMWVYRKNCRITPSFKCEERSCRYPYWFSCGDGECIPSTSSSMRSYRCNNHRVAREFRKLLDAKTMCEQKLFCLLGLSQNWTDHCSNVFSIHYSIDLCDSLTSECDSEWVAVPEKPTLYGFFQFIYLTNRSLDEFKVNTLPDFICFDSQRCSGLLDIITVRNFNNGLVCCHRNDLLDLIKYEDLANFYEIESLLHTALKRCMTIGNESSCSDSALFHCTQSMRCISYHRVMDDIVDCFFGEDESYPACSLNDSTRFICKSDSTKCLSFIAVDNLKVNCPAHEDESSSVISQGRFNPIVYSTFCDHMQDGPYINAYALDELDCEYWPCNSPYVRCDNMWHCSNGIDEVNCTNSLCSSNEHACVLDDYSSFICISAENLYDRLLDNCSKYGMAIQRQIYFDNRTKIKTNDSLAWKDHQCITFKNLCLSGYPRFNEQSETDCLIPNKQLFSSTDSITTYDGKKLCKAFAHYNYRPRNRFFLQTSLGFFPPTSIIPSQMRPITVTNSTQSKKYTIDLALNLYCHQGIFVRYGPNNTRKCLCPPSSFGDRCQWQSQRVSLTLQLIYRSALIQTQVFQLILMLIDENGEIAPNVEHVTFVPMFHCGTKYSLYLLYPNRPKKLSRNYSVHIDVFNRLTLQYHVSFHLPIQYPFLPVNRLAVRLIIPEQVETEKCSLNCGPHGQCRRYANNQTLFFCHCDPGYFGLVCNRTHECLCSEHAKCYAPSSCLCPLHRFGRHCFLEHTICQANKNPCKNDGICIPSDTRLALQKFTCLCRIGYRGATCEHISNQIEIQFEKSFIKSIKSVAIHLITAHTNKKHERITMFKKIPIDRDTITLYTSDPFHIIFVELFNRTYYRTVLREIFFPSEFIRAEVQSNERCSSIDELGNETWIKSPLWRRAKTYPLLCQQNQSLKCFHDDSLMCFCDLDRFANCFEFNHSMVYDCQNWNLCENDGKCLVKNATCPTFAICVCQDCFYGTKCQFSTRGFVLSLDPILGYHIKPHVALSGQSSLVKSTLVISTSILMISIISNILSIITFRMDQPRQFGCGWYLLVSSTFSLCTIILLTVKVWHLVLSQSGILQNRVLSMIHCIFIDGMVSILSTSSDWLNAFVAIERLVAVRQGALFNRKTSQRIAKRMIFIIVTLTFLSFLHDPIHRRLVDDFDSDEQRTWCFVRYSQFLDLWNSITVFFHVLIPFVINLVSVILMIISIAQSRTGAQSKKSFKAHLRDQLSQLKHALITPTFLVLLNLPRLTIPFFTRCMKTPRDPSLFLIGYFAAYVPAMVPFFIFVLPSNRYKEEFWKAIRKIKHKFAYRN